MMSGCFKFVNVEDFYKIAEHQNSFKIYVKTKTVTDIYSP